MLAHSMPDPAPLPARLCDTWLAADGTRLTLRPVCATDVEHTLRFIAALSYAARYFRFGRGDFRIDESEARCLCSPNLAECVDFIVLAEMDGRSHGVGSGRYCLDADGLSAEFAVVVADAWQGQGIARKLIQTLLASAARNSLTRLYGRILSTNHRMLGLAQNLGFKQKPTDRAAVIEVEHLLNTQEGVSRRRGALQGQCTNPKASRHDVLNASCHACPWAPWANRR